MLDAADKNHITLNRNIGKEGDGTTKAMFDFLNANGAKPAGAKQ